MATHQSFPRVRLHRMLAHPLAAPAAAILLAAAVAGCRHSLPFRASDTQTLRAPASDAVAFTLHGRVGDVVVTAEDTEEVLVTARRTGRGTTPEEAEKARNEIRLFLEPSGDTLVARVEHPDDNSDRYRVDWQVRLPAALAVTIEAPVGDVTARGIQRDVAVTNSVGDVVVEKCHAARIRAGTGDVTITDIAEDVTAAVGVGDLRVARVGGSAEVRAGTGDVSLQDIGGRVTLQAGVGSVDVKAPLPIRLRVGTGDIRVTVLGGSGPLEATTGVGDIHAVLPADIAGRLDAHTGVGEVRARLDAANTSDVRLARNRCTARLNDAKEPLLKVSTGVGDVTVEAR